MRYGEEGESDRLQDQIQSDVQRACKKTAELLAKDEWHFTDEYLDEVEEAFMLLCKVRKLLG